MQVAGKLKTARSMLFAYRWDLIAVLLICGLWLLANWHQLSPVKADQWSINNGDFSANNYIYSDYMARRLAAGQFPLWWPDDNVGRPFVADPQAAAFYPLRWLSIIASGGHWTYGSLQTEAIVHLLLAALFTYAAARVITGSIVGGLAASLIFAFSGLLNGFPLESLQILESVTWLPLILLSVHLAITRDQVKWMIVTGILLCIALFAGHIQTVVIMGYLAVAYLVYLSYKLRRNWQKVIGYILIMGLVAAGLGAMQLLPTFQLQALSTRATDLNFATKSGGYTIGMLLQAIWPSIVTYFSPLYIGLASFPLIVIGSTLTEPSEQATAQTNTLSVGFWVGTALVTGILMLGGNTILFTLTYWLVPGIALFRDQERFSLFVVFALAMLAAFGVRRLLQPLLPQQKRVLLIMSLLLVGITGAVALGLEIWTLSGGPGEPIRYLEITFYALAMSVGSLFIVLRLRSTNNDSDSAANRSSAILFLALIAFDLLTFSATKTPSFSPIPVSDRLPRPAYIQNIQPSTYRIDGARALSPYAGLYSLPDISGTNPLSVASIQDLFKLPVDRRWDLFAVRYVISESNSLPTPSRVIDQGDDSTGHFYVHELNDPRPYAWLVYAADVVPDAQFVREIIADSRFNAREKALVDQPLPFALSGTRPNNARADLVKLDPEQIEISVNTPDNALLTVSLPFYPGWTATIDGQPAPILKTYAALSGVAVESGQHTVKLTFGAPLPGLVISAATALLVIIGFIAPTMRKKTS